MSTDLVEHWRFRHKETGQVAETNSESNRDAARAEIAWEEEPCQDPEACIFLDSEIAHFLGGPGG